MQRLWVHVRNRFLSVWARKVEGRMDMCHHMLEEAEENLFEF